MLNNDYILRSDIQKAIGDWFLNDGDKRSMMQVFEDIPAADVEPKQRWIPVTERTPECEVGAEIGNVEWISHEMVFAGCFGRGGKYRDAYFRTWTDANEGIDAKDADCWRVVTLPEPPKGEKDA